MVFNANLKTPRQVRGDPGWRPELCFGAFNATGSPRLPSAQEASRFPCTPGPANLLALPAERSQKHFYFFFFIIDPRKSVCGSGKRRAKGFSEPGCVVSLLCLPCLTFFFLQVAPSTLVARSPVGLKVERTLCSLRMRCRLWLSDS